MVERSVYREQCGQRLGLQNRSGAGFRSGGNGQPLNKQSRFFVHPRPFEERHNGTADALQGFA